MILIRNAMILTMAGGLAGKSAGGHNGKLGDKLDDLAFHGYLLVDPPRIRKVAPGEPPADLRAQPGLEIIDAAGGWLLPGMIDAHCHIGLYNDGLAAEGEDGNEMTDPVTPQLMATDGIFQDDRCFSEAVAAGITSVMTGPGSANVLGGRFAFLHTTGRTVEAMTIRSTAAMKAAFGENPKRVHGRKDKSPATRMATASLLRETLVKATHYLKTQNQGDSGSSQPPREPDLRLEALLPVLSGKMLLKIHAHRTDDILTGIRVANEFGLRYTLDHCTEGYLIADLLAHEYKTGQEPGHGVGTAGLGRLEGIVTGPLLTDRSKPELSRASLVNPAVLASAGLPVAIMTDHPEIPVQYLPVSAAVAVRGGMSEEQALRAVTIDAARLCDAADLLGSLETGKMADLAIWSGHPLDFRSRVCLVFVSGTVVFPSPPGA